MFASSLAALPASLGSSYRPALRWPGIPGLRTPFGRVLAPPPLRGFDRLTPRCFAHRARASCAPRGFSRFAASDESSTPLLIGLTTACFAHCARPSCAPLAAPSLSPSLGSSYRPALRWPGIPGLRTPFGRVLAPPPLRGFDGYGLFRALRAAKLRPKGRALRAPPRHCHIHNSQWSRRCAHRLACDSPLLIGLTTACFRHWRRPSCAPSSFR